MQKKWRKRQQQAEREQQGKLKAERLAKLRDPKARRGYRKIHIDGKVYFWRHYGWLVEIRTPNDKKFIVQCWQIQGYKTEAAWSKEHEECYGDDYCDAYRAQPSDVRDYIVKAAL